MKIISLLHENMLLSSEIKDFYERTGINSFERVWVKELIEEINKSNALNKNKIYEDVKNLELAQKTSQISFKDFFDTFPYLNTRYNYLDDDNLLENGFIYSQIELSFLKMNYVLKYKVEDSIEIKGCQNSAQRLFEKQKMFNLGAINYELNIFHGNSVYYLLEKINNKSFLKEKTNLFLSNFEFLLENDHILLCNFLENNPAIKEYAKMREIIPKILTRCKVDSLIKPASQESVKVYDTLITQQKIYNIEPNIKLNKFT